MPKEVKSSRNSTDLPVLPFERQKDWALWLAKNHSTSSGVWLKLAKKASGIKSVTYDEALEVALCYGWIDGQKKSFDETSWLQKFTPRGAKSKAVAPADLLAALDRNAKAKAFFATLDSRNRYAILHRIHTAKKAETRARRIEQFVRMLANKEK